MKYDSATPYIAAVVIFRKSDKIAFLLRQNTGWLDNYYGLPAGKVEKNENFTQAAIREAEEETGAKILPQDLKYKFTMFRREDSDNTTWIDVIFEAMKWQGELINNEPDKHSELTWFHPTKLPENIIPVTRVYLEKINEGITYGEYGWQE